MKNRVVSWLGVYQSKKSLDGLPSRHFDHQPPNDVPENDHMNRRSHEYVMALPPSKGDGNSSGKSTAVP